VSIKVVKNVYFAPTFLTCNDYIKLVTLQTCWMHLRLFWLCFRLCRAQLEIKSKFKLVAYSFADVIAGAVKCLCVTDSPGTAAHSVHQLRLTELDHYHQPRTVLSHYAHLVPIPSD
jgi:hypothetical protein